MEKRQPFITQKIKNYAYNLKYSFLGYWEGAQLQKILEKNDKISILGTTYLIQDTSPEYIQKTKQKIYQKFASTAWITYRSGFPILLNNLLQNQSQKNSYISDTGWGCMIRVGQMLYAQVLKRHRFQNNVNNKKELSKQQEKEQLDRILQNFNDFDQKAVFSIQNIARLAKKEYNLKPGDWYNPSQIAYILSQLYEHKKIRGYSDSLSFKVFHSGNLFFDQLIQQMLSLKQKQKVLTNLKKCKCLDKKIYTQLICQKCNSHLFANKEDNQENLQLFKKSKSLCLILLTRIGLDKVQPKYLKVLYEMMQSKWYSGILGGKPQKALYFVGKHNNKDFIYLDPHYVHQAKEVQQKQTYFCYSFRKCSSIAIDPSIGISFYLKNLKQLNQYYEFMMNLKKKYQENFFIFMADETPFYAKQVRRKKSEENIKSFDQDYFEEL